jgi:uncharacterized MAPEG superfamily protein
MDARSWLLATTAFTMCLWMPYVLDRFARLGIARTLGNPKPGDADEQSAWAQRAARAHANAVENLVVFAPLALLAIHQGMEANAVVRGACAAYFLARVAHYVLYAAGVPVLRTVSFTAGFCAQLTLAIALYAGGGR